MAGAAMLRHVRYKQDKTTKLKVKNFTSYKHFPEFHTNGPRKGSFKGFTRLSLRGILKETLGGIKRIKLETLCFKQNAVRDSDHLIPHRPNRNCRTLRLRINWDLFSLTGPSSPMSANAATDSK